MPKAKTLLDKVRQLEELKKMAAKRAAHYDYRYENLGNLEPVDRARELRNQSLELSNRLRDFSEDAYNDLAYDMTNVLRDQTRVSPNTARRFLYRNDERLFNSLPPYWQRIHWKPKGISDIRALDDPADEIESLFYGLPREDRARWAIELLKYMDEDEPEKVELLKAYSRYLY